MSHTEVFIQNFSNYLFYHKFVTSLLFHSFGTVFFILWSISTNMVELMGSKPLHCIFPLLALHWWSLSRYPVDQYQQTLLRRKTNDNHVFESADWWEDAKKKQENIVFRNTVKIMMLFFCFAEERRKW